MQYGVKCELSLRGRARVPIEVLVNLPAFQKIDQTEVMPS